MLCLVSIKELSCYVDLFHIGVDSIQLYMLRCYSIGACYFKLSTLKHSTSRFESTCYAMCTFTAIFYVQINLKSTCTFALVVLYLFSSVNLIRDKGYLSNILSHQKAVIFVMHIKIIGVPLIGNSIAPLKE